MFELRSRIHPRRCFFSRWYFNLQCISLQSMRPRGARHDIDVLGSALPTVSIHAPAGGATSTTSTAANIKPVSIHAPAGGATSSVTHVEVPDIPFQSTRPRGARLKSEERFTPVLFRFQSTRPRGARPESCWFDAPQIKVSIHAPAGGATCICK